ncbi:dihydrolipoamide acetyltransferase [Cavenderia fasciculata]|uniref:Acetyltransferase component of pyruvate dehydrogenase complex n=1 Tax=Cavenderia fasciculata TaxID=261658 RepID=F4PKW7_CACFS|nr:dihydrolipoamide acetyltransferase [Cavenderia fasciculata]EGG23189.1 dihydrolipoamide acetyltransferase [Cavenderia fasciculata]|eukprot:XP_004361040.1 dihydrolipoamide acetyltransferase [Cavenderia fasciculata]
MLRQSSRLLIKGNISANQLLLKNNPALLTFAARYFSNDVSTAINNNNNNSSTYKQINTFSSFTSLNTTYFSGQQRLYSTSYPKHIQVGMPALSPSMAEGNLVKWKKNVGDKISVGDIIAEVETDKATMDFEITESGYLAKILKPDGSKGIAINDLIAIIVSKKEDVAKFADYTETAAAAPQEAPKAAAAAPQEAPKAAAPKAAAPKSNYPKHNVVGLPALSPSMETGGLAKWRKNVGDKITAGDIIAEVETDKATMEFEITESGYLAKILVPAGTTGVDINSPICVMVNKKEDVEKFADFTVDGAAAGGAEAPAAVESTTAAPQQQAAPQQSSSSSSSSTGGRIFSSPAARFTAKEKGHNIADITGTGPNGRVIKVDVLEFVPQQKQQVVSEAAATAAAPRPAAAAAAAAPEAGLFTDIPHTNIRRVTASRLTESKQQIPHYYLTMECKVDQLLNVRTQLNNQANNKYKLSVNDFVIKAAAAALRDCPTVNSTWMKDAVRRFHNIDINVAVNTDLGLFTPLIRDADKKGLASVANQVKELAEKAKIGKLQPQDFASGTFTISNLGMFGIKNFSAVINPPQAAILAVGTTEKRIVAAGEDKYTSETVLTVTLSCDHRVIDGAVGAEWLQKFKDYIENPLKLLL